MRGTRALGKRVGGAIFRDRSLERSIGSVSVLVALSLTGCAANLTPGDQLFQEGNYRAAAELFREQELDDLYDPALKQRLAASWLRSGEVERARVKLREAIAIEPTDPSSWFLLGEADAALGNGTDAIAAYQEYLDLGGPERGQVRARIDRIARDILIREVRAAIEGEPGRASADSTLAVSPFLNVAEDETLASLSQGLAAVMITDLRKVRGFRVLERERLGVLLRELALTGEDPRNPGRQLPSEQTEGGLGPEPFRTDAGQSASEEERSAPDGRRSASDEELSAPLERRSASDESQSGEDGAVAGALPQDSEDAELSAQLSSLVEAPPPVDVRTAPRWGELLGVERFVQGFFTPIGSDRLLIGADLVSTTGAAVSAGAPLEGALADVLFLEKGLVRRVLAALGVEPTEEEERELDQLLTGSPEAFFAYARGLRFLDQGRSVEASRAFHEAVVADPSFTEAAEAEELASNDEGSFDEVRADVWDRLIPDRADPLIDERLFDIAVRVGGGPAPDGSGSDGTGPEHEPDSVLGPSDPDRIDVLRTIPSLPPPPGARGSR